MSLLLVFMGRYSRSRGQKLEHFDGLIVDGKPSGDPVLHLLYVRASEALKRGDGQGAEEIYRSIVAKNPGDSQAYESLGACLFLRARYPEARTEYQHALKLAPQSIGALYGMGCVAYSQSSNVEAAAYLQKALAVGGHDASCHRVLGLVYGQAGESSNALFHLERAIELDHSVGDEPEIRDLLSQLKAR